jgi:uracil-DNA glycosylase
MTIKPLLIPGCTHILVGEAPGASEMLDNRPFTGPAAKLLRAMLHEAGLDPTALSMTYVFPEKPRDGDIKNFFIKAKAFKALGHLPAASRKHPTMGYLDPARMADIGRVLQEIDSSGATTAIVLGGVAFWVLGFDHKISAHRGVLHKLTLPSGREINVVGTYNPAMVQREWSYRSVVVADLRKAATGAEAQRTQRKIVIPETLAELRSELAKLADAEFVAYDIETEAKQITCISLARSSTECLVIPIWNKTKPGWHNWSVSDEMDVWRLLWRFFMHKRRWLTQNGTYDMTYLRRLFIKPNGTWEDTMFLHHAVYCEQPKSLGFMGSLYTDEQAWKELRVKKPKGKDIKADE